MPFGWKRTESNATKRASDRKHVRTETALHCEVGGPNANLVMGQVIDLTVQGARLRVKTIEAEGFAPDTCVDLTIHGPQGAWRVKARGRVRHLRNVSGDWTHIGLLFIDVGYLFSQLENALSVYFNRRQKSRIPTLQEVEFWVKLRLGRTIESARVHNISCDGMGIVLGAAQAVPFVKDSVIDLRFTLPGAKKEFACKATVRYHRRAGSEDRLGLEFDHSDEGAWSAQADAIDSYIDKLQKRMAKVLRSLGA